MGVVFMTIDRRKTLRWIGLAGLALAGACLLGCNTGDAGGMGDSIELLNVSYDPTRELWRDLNDRFIAKYEKETGKKVTINQSHGGSGSQARAVIDGQEADVATLALWSDTDAIRAKGLIKDGWEDRFPNHSLPYYSTIVFVVRKGNPKGVHDWQDLVEKPGVEIITPNPKTSGNGKLSFLAAWGSVLHNKGTEEQARTFVARLYQRVPVLDSGARGSTTTFSQNKKGDVHLTWENEAFLEVQESKGDLEVVYPSASIKAEPYIAVVDAVVDRRKTRETAEAYLRSVYDPEAQEIVAKHGYRPIDAEVLARHKDTLPDVTLFSIASVAKDWGEAQKRFFADGGEFDRIYQPGK
jgi:sulfate/thiosulfate transport system substrate-binding protein